MEQRVNSLETDLEILKRDMTTGQASLSKEIEYLKHRKQYIPPWVKSGAVIVLLAVFGQTITSVWWAASISSKQISIQSEVTRNSNFIAAWPAMHEEVMLGIRELQVDSKNLKEMLHDIKLRQNRPSNVALPN
jgi:hypothetical protein